MVKKPPPETKISTSNASQILVRGKDLVNEIIGHMTFTEMFYFHLLKRMPTKGETAILNSVLVTLMEHGLTPSAIATRLTIMSAPESFQGALVAGLLSVGSGLVGTMEGMAKNLIEITTASEPLEAACRRVVQGFLDSKQPIPGFGHPIHKPDDIRTPRLFEVARENGVDGIYINAVGVLSKAVDEAYGKHLTINATGGIAVVLLEIGIPWDVMRGIAVVSRSAGLVGHISEEKEYPIATHMWNAIENLVSYTGKKNKEK